jgi:hypothetical protein
MKFRKPSWPVLLFSLPFFGVGLGFLFLSVIPSLYLGFAVQSWSEVGAELTHAKLEVTYNDGATYRATARYRYEFNGQVYTSDQVGFSKGSDNVGSWQQQKGNTLENRYRNGNGITAYVNPNKPSEAYLYPELRWQLLAFKLVFVVVFGGVGGFLFFASIIEKSNTKTKFEQRVFGSGKSKVRQVAQSDHIYSSARKTFGWLLALAILVFAISSPVLFELKNEWLSGNKAILVALIFPLISLGFFIAAIREGFRILKFGRSPLVLSPFPPSVGGYLGATVQVNTAHDPNNRFHVTLRCLNSFRTTSGGKSKRSERTVWHAQGLAYVERASSGKTQLKFSFNIPSSVPESSEPADSYHFWKVEIEARVGGSTFKRGFDVPVYSVEGAQPTRQYLAVDHPEMSDLTQERIDSLNAKDSGSELEFFVPRFSYAYNRVGGVIFGAIFVGSGVGVYIAGAPFIFPLIFVPIGAIIAWVSLRNYLTAIQTFVNKEGIVFKSSFIGLKKRTVTISSSESVSFTVKNATNVNSTDANKFHFAIEAKGAAGKSIVVVDRIEGRESADALVERFKSVLNRL